MEICLDEFNIRLKLAIFLTEVNVYTTIDDPFGMKMDNITIVQVFTCKLVCKKKLKMLHRIYSCAHIIRFDEKFFSIDCTDRVTHTYIYRFSTIYRESSPRVVRAFPSTLLLFTYSKYEVLSLVRNQCDIFIVEGCACVCVLVPCLEKIGILIF